MRAVFFFRNESVNRLLKNSLTAEDAEDAEERRKN